MPKFETVTLASGHKVVTPVFSSVAEAVKVFGEEDTLNLVNVTVRHKLKTKAALRIKESKPVPAPGSTVITQAEAERWKPGVVTLGARKRLQQLSIDWASGKITEQTFIEQARILSEQIKKMEDAADAEEAATAKQAA